METRTINLGAVNTSVLIQAEGDFVSIRSAGGLVTLTPIGSQKPASPDQKNVLEYTGVFSGASDGLTITNLSAGYAAKIGRYTSIAISSTVRNDTVELQVGYGWVDNRDVSTTIIVPPSIVPPSPYLAQNVGRTTLAVGQSVQYTPLLDYKFLILTLSESTGGTLEILSFVQDGTQLQTGTVFDSSGLPLGSFTTNIIIPNNIVIPTGPLTMIIPLMGASDIEIFNRGTTVFTLHGQFTNNWNT